MSATVLSVGIDDTDSPLGMCTTYLGFKIVGKLRKKGVKFSSYPRLVRFNPNIPWKTRGNGAVGLTFLTNDAKEDMGFKIVGKLRKKGVKFSIVSATSTF